VLGMQNMPVHTFKLTTKTTCPASRRRAEMILYLSPIPCAPVAQLDRAVASEATGREFESLRAHHQINHLPR
jgi:hypothetical protein